MHAYAAGFYGRTGGTADFGSLDETALVAVGVLLEEWAEVVLGKKGHEVFVEGERRNADNGDADMEKEKEVEDEMDVEVVAEESREERRRKRRKVTRESDEGNTDG